MIRQAVKEARKEYRRFDWSEREQVIAEVQRLTDTGVSAATIAQMLGFSDRHVQRLRGAKAPEIAERSFEVSADRARQLAAMADGVLELAVLLRDEDPQLVWDALSKLDRRPLQELTVIALAGLNIDAKKSDIWGWLLS